MNTKLFVLAVLFSVIPLFSLHAQEDEALPALVQVLGQTDDPQFQFAE